VRCVRLVAARSTHRLGANAIGDSHASDRDVQLNIGDEVDISVKDGIMIVTPAKRIRGRHKLKDLVARIPENYQTSEVDWGEPVGKEAW